MRLLTLSATLLAVLATTATAQVNKSAVITPSGVGDLRVGLSEEEAEGVLDRAITIERFPGSDCGTAKIGHNSYALFTGDRLRRVSVRSNFWATAKGVTVSDDESAITRNYKHAKRTPHAYVDGYYYEIRRGNRKIVFETKKGIITTIHGGAKPEVNYIEACA